MLNSNYGIALFDLDGTLADTAPDIVRAFYRYCDQHAFARPDYETLRAKVSTGVISMLEMLYPQRPRESLKPEWDTVVSYYAEDLASETTLFEGVVELLDALDANGKTWGVVSNKPAHLTQPLLDALGIGARAACIVGGDTTPYKKPHPGSLLHATKLLSSSPANCVYVGDAEIDVQASRAAGMPVVIAEFGYAQYEDSHLWGADALLSHPLDLLECLTPSSA